MAGDLKCGNVILDERMVPRVADFGVSTTIAHFVENMGDAARPMGTMRRGPRPNHKGAWRPKHIARSIKEYCARSIGK